MILLLKKFIWIVALPVTSCWTLGNGFLFPHLKYVIRFIVMMTWVSISTNYEVKLIFVGNFPVEKLSQAWAHSVVQSSSPCPHALLPHCPVLWHGDLWPGEMIGPWKAVDAEILEPSLPWLAWKLLSLDRWAWKDEQRPQGTKGEDCPCLLGIPLISIILFYSVSFFICTCF